MQRWTGTAVMWGALLIWIGVMGVVDERAGVASIGAGAILLTIGVLRRASGMRSGFVVTVGGLLLVAIGLNDLNGDDNGIPLFAVALIAFGALIIGKALGAGKRRGTSIVIHRTSGPPRDPR